MSNAKNTRSLLAAGITTVAAAGCFGGRLPPEEYYRLSVPDSAQMASPVGLALPGLPPTAGSIAIAPYAAPGLYGSGSVVYRIGETEYGIYPSRLWALPVATMVGLITQDVLREHPISAESPIFDPPSYHSHRYVWRGAVRHLEEVDRGKSVFAAVQFDARLIRTADDSIVWAGTVSLERPVPQGTMPAIVEMLSRLSVEAVARLADEARGAVARSAATAGR